MNKLSQTAVLSLIATLLSCSGAPGLLDGGSGGRPGAGGSAGNPGLGGSSGVGGGAGVGGDGAGGTVDGMGGSPGTGGSPGAGGMPGAGGTPGAGGSAGAGGRAGAGGNPGVGGAAGGSADAGGMGGARMDAGTPDAGRFSFFVISYAAITRAAGTDAGFGGDLRNGQTGLGAGLKGADALCAQVAERSKPGSGAKVWRAFLSADQGEDGGVVNARDRIGNGPWYDRLGRLFANNLTDAMNPRPLNCNPAICDDLPNEDGVPNQAPDGMALDNHDTLTGSDSQGRRLLNGNCQSWTTRNTVGTGTPGLGHSWPANSGRSWFNVHPARGCGAGVNFIQNGPGVGSNVGSGGGYGGWYCFALTP